MNADPFSETVFSYVVTKLLQEHMDNLGDSEPSDFYRKVMDLVEPPMLLSMMRYTHGNQQRAADCLGINKTTLRTKLKRHGLMQPTV
ncbi:MAG: helix-turn-helix domain-containing protein [Candidatus Thiothrix putei]|uniref:Putative Fis-like DNA-binding protein n=1 Tax=Candidatus Thiothrix putei TaxID=3080811 RepID=A0AA95HGH9_9GAMM|nr:MAG: helix-turn-helix domain-containing protein [Candidatus Thiothrix putei]